MAALSPAETNKTNRENTQITNATNLYIACRQGNWVGCGPNPMDKNDTTPPKNDPAPPKNDDGGNPSPTIPVDGGHPALGGEMKETPPTIRPAPTLIDPDANIYPPRPEFKNPTNITLDPDYDHKASQEATLAKENCLKEMKYQSVTVRVPLSDIETNDRIDNRVTRFGTSSYEKKQMIKNANDQNKCLALDYARQDNL